jgi:hypothetical protein
MRRDEGFRILSGYNSGPEVPFLLRIGAAGLYHY